jgi:hypothetical protein
MNGDGRHGYVVESAPHGPAIIVSFRQGCLNCSG